MVWCHVGTTSALGQELLFIVQVAPSLRRHILVSTDHDCSLAPGPCSPGAFANVAVCVPMNTVGLRASHSHRGNVFYTPPALHGCRNPLPAEPSTSLLHHTFVTEALHVLPLLLHPPSFFSSCELIMCRNELNGTQQCASGSINQIPPHASVSGDCRITPFYGVAAVAKSIEGYVAEINADPSILPSHGPFSKYVLPGEDRKGTLELKWLTEGEDGIACNLSSEGSKALNSATEKVSPLYDEKEREAFGEDDLNTSGCDAQEDALLCSVTAAVGQSRSCAALAGRVRARRRRIGCMGMLCGDMCLSLHISPINACGAAVVVCTVRVNNAVC